QLGAEADAVEAAQLPVARDIGRLGQCVVAVEQRVLLGVEANERIGEPRVAEVAAIAELGGVRLDRPRVPEVAVLGAHRCARGSVADVADRSQLDRAARPRSRASLGY